MEKTIITDRLILRPWKMDDADAFFYGWANDPEVTKYLTWNPHENIEVTKSILSNWIDEYKKPERINFAIELKDNHELIGGIDVVGYLDGVPVIGYTLKKDKWNNGYMTEACKALIDFLFSLGHDIIRIDAMVQNIGSNKVILKCGGIFDGVETQEVLRKNCTAEVNRYYIKRK